MISFKLTPSLFLLKKGCLFVNILKSIKGPFKMVKFS